MNQQSLNGFLNIYKEPGWTSMDVCAKLKRVLGVKKAGHAGTLDPMAEGVLPVALGRATKETELLSSSKKCYRAGMLLGTVTDTEDITGEIVNVISPAVGEDEITAAVLSFIGEYDQLTPRYSARKLNGRPLYKYARAGVDVERRRKKVRIYDIDIEKIDLPHVIFTVSCSGGTYVRTLCNDIGEKLRCGACMESLERLSVGDFYAEDALRIADVERLQNCGNVDARLRVLAPTAVSIGKFDGAHLGHQALFRELRKVAANNGYRTLAIILRSDTDTVISDSERKSRIYELGIDYVIELNLDKSLMETSAMDFIGMLIRKYNMRAIVAGEDISFGNKREGNAAFLEKYAKDLGIGVYLIKKVNVGSIKDHSSGSLSADIGKAYSGNTEISSTLIRKMLAEGSMEAAAGLLGAPYSLSGVIVKGRHIGTDRLGVPTLNINVPDTLVLPPRGVYAVKADISECEDGPIVKSGYGIANLGLAPTVADKSAGAETGLRLETHLFDDIGEAYGLYISVELLSFIRPERIFADAGELKEQILSKDIPGAADILGISLK